MKEKAIRRNPDMVSRTIADQTMLLPVFKNSDEVNSIYSLNEQAAAVWSLIDNKRSIGQIEKMLRDKYEGTPETIKKRLDTLLAELKEIKAIL